MFAAPPVLETTVFATIPKSPKAGTSAWFDMQPGMPPTLGSFIEGPSFDRAGNLWIVDIPYGRLFRIGPDGDVSLALEYDGWPNGLKFHRDGRAFIADNKHGIMVFDPATGAIAPHLARGHMERFKGLNDLLFASNGDLYFTDQGDSGLQDPSGRLYRLRADGPLEIVLDGLPSPNGLVLSLDEKTLYLCVTRDNAVWRVPLMPGAPPTKVGAFIRLSGGVGPDGIAIDEAGNLAVCHPGLGSVWLFSPVGEPLYRIKSQTGPVTTNCAYGGAGGKALFITESITGTVLQAQLPVAGKAMFSHT